LDIRPAINVPAGVPGAAGVGGSGTAGAGQDGTAGQKVKG
jgi:hypothetical protein